MPIEIVDRGAFAQSSRKGFRDALGRVLARSTRRPVFVRGSLERDRNPSVERPVHAEAMVDFGARSVRARSAARTSTEAIDLLVRRLRTELQKQQGRRLARRRQPSRRRPS